VFSGTGGVVGVTAGVTASRGITATTTGYTLSGGTLSLTGASATDNTISVSTAATLALNLPLSGSTGFRKTGAGALVFNQASVISGTASIAAGTVRLANAQSLLASTLRPLAGGTATVAGQGLTTTVAGLDPNAGGLVDVGTGMVTVASGLSPANLVTALLAGRGDGTWNGTAGITSSQAKADLAGSIPRTVGWLDNGNGSMTFAYAAPGDTNLDWSIDILDIGNFLALGKFDTGLPATWFEGDFDYNGIVDILDVAEFVSTGLYNAGGYNSASGAIAAVPEPSTLGLLGVGAGVVGLMAARRKRVV
jgi:autotransporter-associated beta strand protein